jgi:DNA-binding transcriptional MocR family regulator
MSRENAKTLFEDLGVTKDAVALTTGAPGERHLIKVAGLLSKASGHVMRLATGATHDTTFLQYGPKQGSPRFRTQLAQFLSQGYKDDVSSESVVVTSGATHGLHLVASVLIGGNAPVFVEDPTYFIAIDIVKKDLGRPVLGVSCDDEGIDVEALEKKFLANKAAHCEPGEYAGMVYLVTTYHNPRGYCIPPRRCEALVALARKHNLLLFCDDVYNLLHFDSSTVAPARLLSYDKPSDSDYQGNVISNSSFSKILSPGLRLGWIEAGMPIVKKLVGSNILWSAGSSNHYTSEMVASALELNLQQEYLKELNAEYKEIVASVLDIMDNGLPSTVKYNRPKGGYFIWIELPEGSKAIEIIQQCVKEHNVKALPGAMCSASGSCQNCIRISFSHYPPDKLYFGVTKLCEAINSYLKK